MLILYLQKIIDTEAKIKLTDLIKLALDRAESLKGLKSIDNNDILKTLSKLPSVPETSLDEDEEKISPTIITTSAINSSNTGNFLFVIAMCIYLI